VTAISVVPTPNTPADNNLGDLYTDAGEIYMLTCTHDRIKRYYLLNLRFHSSRDGTHETCAQAVSGAERFHGTVTLSTT